MANTISFAIFLSLSYATIALPLAHDSVSLRASDSARASELNETASEFDVVLILSRDENSERDTKPVQNFANVPTVDAEGFNMNDIKRLRRTKRELITDKHRCARRMIYYAKQCVTFEK